MHEQSYIDSITMDVKNLGSVSKIVLEVGELAGIEGGHLKEHIIDRFGWNVDIVNKDAVVKCECGYRGHPKILERLHDFVVFECEKCGEIPEILEGSDIKILKIVYD